jgi:hypothetical protein
MRAGAARTGMRCARRGHVRPHRGTSRGCQGAGPPGTDAWGEPPGHAGARTRGCQGPPRGGGGKHAGGRAGHALGRQGPPPGGPRGTRRGGHARAPPGGP